MRIFLTAASAASLLLASTSPASAVQFFTGRDDAAGPGELLPNSRGAQSAFLVAAAKYGGVVTDGFETVAPGMPLSLSLAGLDIYMTANDYGPDMSGVTNFQINPEYGFNTTIGGSQWLGFPDLYYSQAFFIFENPTNSFGFFATGIQASYTASLTFTLFDGSERTIDLPTTANGGASFFGLVDTVGFTQAVLTQQNSSSFIDAWGIDDISYNFGDAPLAVPEPGTWTLLIAGFGMIGFAARRRHTSPAIS